MNNLSPIQMRLLSRLVELPTKANRPLTELFKIEHIEEQVLSDVLDMVVLGGHAEHALGYVVSYQHLVKSNVPMTDIIKMAKENKRKLNPAWSRTRWMEEHRKLSRVATLVALTSENVLYDLDEYKTRLPNKFAGYVISTSRRLGAEGLRQDHCVASYNSRISSGQCCIVVVFVNKERWTVQLNMVADHLRVSQVKSRHNKPADSEILEKIHEELEIEMPSVNGNEVEGATNRGDALRTNLLTVCNRLRILDVNDVTVEFDGGGDSGTIYEPTIVFITDGEVNAKELLRSIDVNFIRLEREYDSRLQVFSYRSATAVTNLYDALQEVIEDHIDSTGADFSNGDGGRGTYVLNVVEQTYDLDIDGFYTESTMLHCEEGSPIADI